MEAAAALQLRLLQHPLMPHVLKAVANVHLPGQCARGEEVDLVHAWVLIRC